MKRIIFSILLTFIITTNLSVAHASQDGLTFEPDANQLKPIMTQLVGDLVEVTINPDGLILLSGTKETTPQALDRLKDFDAVRQVLLPSCQTRVISSDLKCWDDFVVAAEIDRDASDLFNTRSKWVKDEDGRFTVDLSLEFNHDMALLYHTNLTKSSKFFAWAEKNVPHFYTLSRDTMVINYALLREFLTVNALTTVAEDSDVMVGYISSEDMMKNFVAAASGNIVLTKDPLIDGKRRVNVITQGEGFGDQDVEVEFLVDVSTSMRGDPINTVNAQLPSLLLKIKSCLPQGQRVKFLLNSFDNRRKQWADFDIAHGDSDETIKRKLPTIRIGESATNLTLIEESFSISGSRFAQQKERRKLLFGFTDGAHNTGESLEDCFGRLKLCIGNEGFAQCLLFKLGTSDCEFFSLASSTLGGDYYTVDSVPELMQTTEKNLSSMLKARKALITTLHGASLPLVEWVRVDEPGIFASKHLVATGDSVKLGNDPALTVQEPIVLSPRHSGVAVEEEEEVSEDLDEQMAKLQEMMDALKAKKAAQDAQASSVQEEDEAEVEDEDAVSVDQSPLVDTTEVAPKTIASTNNSFTTE